MARWKLAVQETGLGEETGLADGWGRKKVLMTGIIRKIGNILPFVTKEADTSV
jgi:hypothetical protein